MSTPTSYKTVSASALTTKRKWYVIDAENLVLGRLATQVATILMGKNKPTFTPNADTGDYVIILNSDKVRLTGSKWNDKEYIRYTGYPGGQRRINAKDLNERHPIALVETAVKGMLPKTRLGRQMFKKLFVYQGVEHPHSAQKPEVLKLN